MNDWNRLRAHYESAHAEIMAEEKNEWAIDPYAWEGGKMQMTPIEVSLWHEIRGCNMVVYPQYPVGRFFVDFANPKAKVAIECDGKAWHEDKAKDAARDAVLESMGWIVYRISGSDCNKLDEEVEDEYGGITAIPNPAKLFIRRICTRHQISRNNYGGGKSWWDERTERESDEYFP